MVTKHLPLFTLLAGIALCGAGATTLRAQAPAAGTAPAFYVAEVEPTDPEGIRSYSAQVASTFEPFGGRYIARGGALVALAGEAPRGRLVVIAFDSMERAQAWYNSPAYAALRPMRQRSGRSRTFIIEGVPN